MSNSSRVTRSMRAKACIMKAFMLRSMSAAGVLARNSDRFFWKSSNNWLGAIIAASCHEMVNSSFYPPTGRARTGTRYGPDCGTPGSRRFFRAVLDRLSHMGGFDPVAAVQVGQRPRHAQRPSRGARRPAPRRDGARQQRPATGIGLAVTVQEDAVQLGVQAALARQLP